MKNSTSCHHVLSSDMIGRRDAISLTFECEECGLLDAKLVIQQHKGHTLIYWETNDGNSHPIQLYDT